MEYLQEKDVRQYLTDQLAAMMPGIKSTLRH